MDRLSRAALALVTCITLASPRLAGETVPSALAPSGSRDRPKVALVLAGGGARGLAHIGVLKVIKELGIPVDIVTGTSMGAIIGSLYSIGYEPEEIDAIMSGTDWIDLFSEYSENASEPYPDKKDRGRYFAKAGFDRKGFIMSGGFLTGRKALHTLDALFLSIPEPTDFDDLPRRFRAVSVDIATGNKVIHDHGSLADAIRASMSIPGVFMPYRLNGQDHVDGFVADNLPINLARSLGADLVLAIDLDDTEELDPAQFDRNLTQILSRTVTLMTRNGVTYQLPNADCVLTVDTHGYTSLDFEKTREIINLGERSARDDIAALTAFRDKCLKAGAELTEIKRCEMAVVQSIVVEGGTEGDRAYIRNVYEPLVGTAPTPQTMEALFAQLDRDIRFETIRVKLDTSAERPALVITLKDHAPRSSFFRMAFTYQSTYSRHFVNGMAIEPGVIIRGFPFSYSRLTIDAEAFDSPGVNVQFSQPFFDFLSINLYYLMYTDLDTWVVRASPDYLELSSATTAGLGISFYTWTGGEASFGCSYDRTRDGDYTGVIAGAAVDDAFCLHASLDLDTTSSPILPRFGFRNTIGLLYSLPFTTSQRAFGTVSITGGVFIPVGDAVTLGLSWLGGTDFTPQGDAAWAAPLYYKPRLDDRMLFPGLLTQAERIGSHVFGTGLTIQYILNADTTTRNIPVSALVQASAGSACQNGEDFVLAADRIHLTACAGLGMRINDAFGVMVRAGATRNTESEWLPFVAIDLGAFGQ